MQHKKIAKAFFRVLAACVMVFALVLGNHAVGYAEDAVKPAEEDIKLLENCTADFDANKLVVTDTDDNNDVWSSKLLLDAGLELTPGEQYKLSFSLAGENGVGEFFLCKSENRYDGYYKKHSHDKKDQVKVCKHIFLDDIKVGLSYIINLYIALTLFI